jgi:hypothetical protein
LSKKTETFIQYNMRINVETFQKLYAVSLMEADEVEKSAQYVQILTGKTDEQVNRMKVRSFNKMCAQINKSFELVGSKLKHGQPKNFVWANGRLYKLVYDIKTAGKYVETATFANDIIGNLHLIMATIAQPVRFTWKGLKPATREHNEIAEDMLKLDMGHAYQAAVFFYLVFRESLVNSMTYFQEHQTVEREAVATFIKSLDGFTMPNWSANLRTSV